MHVCAWYMYADIYAHTYMYSMYICTRIHLPPRERLRWQECKDANHHFAGFEFLRTGVCSLYFFCVRASQQASEKDLICVSAFTCVCLAFLFFYLPMWSLVSYCPQCPVCARKTHMIVYIFILGFEGIRRHEMMAGNLKEAGSYFR